MPAAFKSATRSALTSLFVSCAFAATIFLGQPHAALALSELQGAPAEQTAQQGPPATGEPQSETPDYEEDPAPGATGLPLPDPLIDRSAGRAGATETTPDNAAPVEVIRDIEKAPAAVQRMRQLIIEAAASGDIKRLRPLMNPGPNQTQVAFGETVDDPIEYLKSVSGDSDGIEILAILLDIVSTGFVHVGKGTADEAYVWPYFTEKSLPALTPPEKVELLRIVTAGDFADMLEFGGYNFYRIGITPDGQWKFFVAGD